ncbi:zinc ribbon domain-containing protein [Halorubrum kocurii]|uniref:DUF7575 domain-containing protein n=1 Tax=Halorubrum kocurii JCM 14978 TaxID=1230456 RepID=M0NTD7_9EURY|nr:zinc ribbon domain-containing protein [Halorubrum kocurii]EMA59895.1 hypothetical protein C468_13923 [Halorubrum kocurii JCM 14978]
MSDSDTSRRRPWLAAALALVVSGLGHAYLRRWARAFGWYVVITATLVFVVPDAAVDGILAGDRPPVVEVAPALVAVAASVVDAYVLAVRNNRKHERRSTAGPTDAAPQRSGAEGAWRTGTTSEAASTESKSASESPESPESPESDTGAASETASCPHCGRQADAELEFCQWCAEPLEN